MLCSRGDILSFQEYYPVRSSISGETGAVERSPTSIPAPLASPIRDKGVVRSGAGR